MHTTRFVASAACTLLALPLAEPLRAQCTLQWQDVPVSHDPSSPIPVGTTVNGGCVWDPDGPGPAPQVFAFCGVMAGSMSFGTPYPITTQGKTVASYDPASGLWQLVGNGDGYMAISTQAMPFPSTPTPEAWAICAADNGDLFVGGLQLNSALPYAGYVHRWNGTSWTGIGDANGGVLDVLCMPDGDVVAAGSFTQIGGVPANGVARWNGTTWSALGTGAAGSVASLALLPNGDLVAAGAFPNEAARWDGMSWQSLTPGANWVPLGVLDVAVLPGGNVVAGGAFVSAASLVPPATNVQMVRVAEWNGTGWQGYGPTISINNPPEGPVTRLTAMLDGSVVAGGSFQQIGGVAANNVARWDGTAWSALGTGLGTQPQHQIFHLSVLPNGDVMAGGVFDTTPTTPAPPYATINMARLRTAGCTARAMAYGTGCVGTGGANNLTANSLPWIGQTVTTTTNGAVPGSVAIGLWGFAQASVPLAALHPAGQVGCSLLVDALHIELILATGTTVQAQLTLPNNQALVGFDIHHQLGLAELGAGGVATAFTSSNALTLTIGGY